MSDNLRRSTRRSKKRAYSVGDMVEIETASGNVSRGRLLSKLTTNDADAAKAPLWRVGYDDPTAPEEDVCESEFGEVVGKITTPTEEQPIASSVPSKKSSGAPKSSTTKVAATDAVKAASRSHPPAPLPPPQGKSSPSNATLSSSGSLQGGSKSNDKVVTLTGFPDNKKKNPNKKATLSQPPSPPSLQDPGASDSSTTHPSDATGSNKAARASAREERSKRRQALQEVEGPSVAFSLPPSQGGARIGTNGGSSSKNGSTHGGGSSRPNKKLKKSSSSASSNHHGSSGGNNNMGGPHEVVKIPMLTGTLFLYKGLHRRAEFVRKF